MIRCLPAGILLLLAVRRLPRGAWWWRSAVLGALTVGDLAVVVAASAPHRGEAFAAARDLIDTLKAEVPIWKHQGFADGSTEWVGLP